MSNPRPTDWFDAEEISELRAISPWRSVLGIAHCWGVIVATWAIVVVWTNPLTVLAGVVIIGARQLGLFILSHDGAHYLLHPNKRVNDWMCEWLLNRALLGTTVEGYRKTHLLHHAHTQQVLHRDDDSGRFARPWQRSESNE